MFANFSHLVHFSYLVRFTFSTNDRTFIVAWDM